MIPLKAGDAIRFQLVVTEDDSWIDHLEKIDPNAPAEGGLITHNLVTALISPAGRLVHIWKRNEWTPADVHRRLKETLAEVNAPKLGMNNRLGSDVVTEIGPAHLTALESGDSRHRRPP